MAHGIIRSVFRPDLHGEKHNQLKYNSMSGVTRDATSGIYCPATAAEWTTTMAAAGISSGGPSLLWLMQEAAGNVADSIGSFTGTVAGTPTYRAAVSGWTRLGLSFTETAGNGITNTSASLPDVSTTSILFLDYAQILAAPTLTRNLHVIGTTDRAFTQVSSTPRLVGTTDTGGGTSTGTAVPTGAVRPFVISINRTASTLAMSSNQERLTPTFGAANTGKQLRIGVTGTIVSSVHTYAVMFAGAAAELTATQLRTLLQTLGWTISW